jgi:hypothetical protein
MENFRNIFIKLFENLDVNNDTSYKYYIFTDKVINKNYYLKGNYNQIYYLILFKLNYINEIYKLIDNINNININNYIQKPNNLVDDFLLDTDYYELKEIDFIYINPEDF